MVNRLCRLSPAQNPTLHRLLATVVVFRVFCSNFPHASLDRSGTRFPQSGSSGGMSIVSIIELRRIPPSSAQLRLAASVSPRRCPLGGDPSPVPPRRPFRDTRYAMKQLRVWDRWIPHDCGHTSESKCVFLQGLVQGGLETVLSLR